MLCMRPRPRPRCNRIWSKCSALIFRHGVSAVAVVRLWQLMSIRHRSTLFQLACRPGTPGHAIRSGSPHMTRPISVPAVFSSGLNSLSRQALGPHRPSQVLGTFEALKGASQRLAGMICPARVPQVFQLPAMSRAQLWFPVWARLVVPLSPWVSL